MYVCVYVYDDIYSKNFYCGSLYLQMFKKALKYMYLATWPQGYKTFFMLNSA